MLDGEWDAGWTKNYVGKATQGGRLGAQRECDSVFVADPDMRGLQEQPQSTHWLSLNFSSAYSLSAPPSGLTLRAFACCIDDDAARGEPCVGMIRKRVVEGGEWHGLRVGLQDAVWESVRHCCALVGAGRRLAGGAR